MGALRHGEAAGLCWRQVVTGLEPLGRLVVLTSYDQGDTKTGAERWMPLHPVLAAPSGNFLFEADPQDGLRPWENFVGMGFRD